MPKDKDDDSEIAARRLRSAATDEAAKLAAGSAAAENLKLNVIEFSLGGEGGGTSKASQENRKRADKSDRPRSAKSADPPASRIPDSVHERFIAIGNNFYFPDGQDAFVRESNRLTTRSENAIVIQSMVAIARAESRSGAVTVGGSDFFKKEAWFAANLVGLEVKGYEPTEFERERLVRAVAARAPRADGNLGRGDPLEGAVSKEANTALRPADGELLVGRLVDHGSAPHQHNAKEPPSYFVRIETAQGDRDIWGADLERAFRNSLSTPGIGDEVGVRALNKEEGAAGERWSVERKTFLNERQQMAQVFKNASIGESEGIKRHPELEGSYQKLHMGEGWAAEQYTGEAHRAQFVEHLRAYLSKRIENGQPLEPGTSRPREDQTVDPRIADRDLSPTR